MENVKNSWVIPALVYERIAIEIEDVVARSKIPEDPAHSKNTCDWMLRLRPEADDALKIAALGHDIERAYSETRILRTGFTDYDDYKNAHAGRSAEILASLVIRNGASGEFAREVGRLTGRHECGGDPRSDLLKYADSISFFDSNIPLYFSRNGRGKALIRARWGLKRLNRETIEIVKEFHYENDELQLMMNELLRHCMAQWRRLF